MITTYDVIRTFKRAKEQGKDLTFIISDDLKTLTCKDGSLTVTVEDFAQFMREKQHCDFEVVYSEHMTLTTVYRCKECGTVIFGGDDEERFDPLLCCPTCGGYETHLPYWTHEEIQLNVQKQESIAFYEKMQYEQEEASKRYIARGGLYDWQIFKKDWHGKKHCLHVELQHWKVKQWWKANTVLEINIGDKRVDNCGYVVKKSHSIPLSPYAFYIKHIYPYTKRCHPEFKKYLPWKKHEV
jgi:DNA-directed RNA polymerase subunit RPC12/RpoP